MTTSTATDRTYPLPPAPEWATEHDVDGEPCRVFRRDVGWFTTADKEPQRTVVQVFRWDDMTATTLTEGPTLVWLLSTELVPEQARVLAGLLTEAADLAEGVQR